MTDWQPIETAPKDGTAILTFDPEGWDVDSYVYTWPADSRLSVAIARWHEPNQRTREEAGWYVPHVYISPGVWDDPGTDYYQTRIEPTHWMPLPKPPES